MRILAFIVSYLVIWQLCISQSCLTVNFNIDNTTPCIDERLDITNLTSDGLSHYWDFCSGDLQVTPSSSEILSNSRLNRSFDMRIKQTNDNWYAFSSSESRDGIARMSFNSQLDDTPDIDEITNGFLNSPKAIDVVEINGTWYALVGNDADNNLVLFDFGSSLDSAPNISFFDNLLPTAEITDIEIFEFGGTIYAFIVNEADNNLVLLNFGSSLTNTPSVSSETITEASSYTDLAIVRDCDEYYGLLTSFDDRTVVLVSFGIDPRTVDSSTELILAGVNFNSRPTNAILTNEGGIFQGFVLIFITGDLVRIDFGDSMENTPSGTTFSDVVPGGVAAFDVAQDSSDWIGYTIGLNSNRLYRLDWSNPCFANPQYSTAEVPAISYTSDGDFKITLERIDGSGNPAYTSSDVTVSSDIAPLISFSINNTHCISVANTFTGSMTGLTYSWDFDGDGIEDSDEQNPKVKFDTLSGAGTYTVRLDVSDDICNNFYEKEITIYDPPPAAAYTYSSAQTCINADFTFTNTTNDVAYMGPLKYIWEFIDEPSGTVVATSTSKDVIYAFGSEGQKTVRLTSSILGCTEVTEQTLMITPGPSVLQPASVCQGEAMQFTNSNTDAVSYLWDFGDGFTSTATNPSHIFAGAGIFFVTSTATDSPECNDNEIIEVSVWDSPQISFDFDVPCTSVDGAQFFDLTTVDNADLAFWTWYVDGIEVSTQQSPQIVFASADIKNIRLDVQSSNGCESSYSEDIEILASPQPDFSMDIGCQDGASVFTDITVATGNPIVSWLWTVDGTNYGTQAINHTFTDAGMFDVTLEVTGQNFCSQTITKTIEIIELPVISFSVNGECDNEFISAQDQSTPSTDPVVSRRWMLDGVHVGNGSQLLLESLEDDTYELALELETASGCMTSVAQTLEINIAPESSFSSSRTYGVPGDQLTFTNSSSGAVLYQWLLDGAIVSSDDQSQSIGFTDAGIYNVSLIAQNSLGCNDTTNQEIVIAIPEIDLSIGSFEWVQENNTGRILLEVQNFSNLPVEMTEALIVLDNQFTVTKQILAFIDVGESSLVSLNVGIPLTISEPSYFCVKLSSQYVDYLDINQANNEKCITIKPLVRVENPFPNPVVDRFRLKVIVPEDGVALLTLMNSVGKIHSAESYHTTGGLNNFFVDMSTLDSGLYFVTVEIAGVTFTRKVIKI